VISASAIVQRIKKSVVSGGFIVVNASDDTILMKTLEAFPEPLWKSDERDVYKDINDS
jgi:hypothetical protein